MPDSTALAEIEYLRRQIHIHSVLYYHLHSSVVSDSTFDAWSDDLIRLQLAFPSLAMQGSRHELFADWTGETGMHLPADPLTTSEAEELLFQ